MWVQSGRMVSLGYGKYVRSDEVAAVEGLEAGRRGPGRRALVWVRGLAQPLIASRSEEAIVRDLTDEGPQRNLQRLALEHVVRELDCVPSPLRRRLRERDGIDIDALVGEAQRAIA